MPHCIIEYAQTIEDICSPEKLIKAVYSGALNSQLFEPEDIKTRAIPFNNYTTGTVKQNFIHICLKILSGRTCKQRQMLSSLVLTELEYLSLSSLSLTVEVIEIERDSYSKKIM